MRKPIFDIIRVQRGKGFTRTEVREIDALLDRLGMERDDVVNEPTVPGSSIPTPPSSAGSEGLDNPQDFYDSIRNFGIFGNRLKPDQVNGLKAILTAARLAQWPLAFIAYALATTCHETAYTMQPVREAFWLSENWRRSNLRYYPYYGRGYVQLTWKRNYEKADRELNLGGQLIDNLDLALDPVIAAKIMMKGMEKGWFCGDRRGKRHTLTRHVPSQGKANRDQFSSARRIINGIDKAGKIAGEAIKFQVALEEGGW